VVYVFYPETSHRGLEEMDSIFRKTDNVIQTVSIAKNEPHRYGKKGELLMGIDDIDDDVFRRASVASLGRKSSIGYEKSA
jgi:hypothetical protein